MATSPLLDRWPDRLGLYLSWGVVQGARWMLQHAYQWVRGLAWLSLGILPLLAFLRIDSRWNPDNPGFNETLLTHQSELQALIPEDAIVIAGPDNSAHIWLYYLDRKGFTFDQRGLSHKLLDRWMESGASVLIVGDPEEKPYTGPKSDRDPHRIGSIEIHDLEK